MTTEDRITPLEAAQDLAAARRHAESAQAALARATDATLQAARKLGISQHELAHAAGLSEGEVSQRLSDGAVQALLAEMDTLAASRLTQAHLRAVKKCPPEIQRELLAIAFGEGWPASRLRNEVAYRGYARAVRAPEWKVECLARAISHSWLGDLVADEAHACARLILESLLPHVDRASFLRKDPKALGQSPPHLWSRPEVAVKAPTFLRAASAS